MMDKIASIQVEVDRLELDVKYKIYEDETIIEYLGVASHFYWNQDNVLSDEITGEHVRELMDAINRAMWSQNFSITLLTQIPLLMIQNHRTDLAAVAMDWLSAYHIKPNHTRL